MFVWLEFTPAIWVFNDALFVEIVVESDAIAATSDPLMFVMVVLTEAI